MANSLGNTPGVLIAQRALKTLLEEFPFLNKVTADFSDENALFNQTVDVKLPTAFGAAGTYSGSTGYAASDSSQVDIPITINQHAFVTYGFNDQERTSYKTDLIERFATAAAQSIGLAMVNSLLGLVTAANFANNTVVGTSSFNRAALIGVSETLNGRKVPKAGRFALLNSSYFGDLAEDTLVIANPASPSDAVKSGVIGNVHGFSVMEYAQLPNNSQSLGGFAGIPESLLIATRLPTLPQAPVPGTIEVVTDENTGLSLQVRQWYDMLMGKEYRTYTLMYGVAAGNPLALQRITTA